MAAVALPSLGIPPWAQEISDDQWKDMVQQTLDSRQSAAALPLNLKWRPGEPARMTVQTGGLYRLYPTPLVQCPSHISSHLLPTFCTRDDYQGGIEVERWRGIGSIVLKCAATCRKRWSGKRSVPLGAFIQTGWLSYFCCMDVFVYWSGLLEKRPQTGTYMLSYGCIRCGKSQCAQNLNSNLPRTHIIIALWRTWQDLDGVLHWNRVQLISGHLKLGFQP